MVTAVDDKLSGLATQILARDVEIYVQTHDRAGPKGFD